MSMKIQFGLLTVFVIITTVVVGLVARGQLYRSLGLLPATDEVSRGFVSIHIWSGIASLLVWVLAATWIIKRGSLKSPQNRFVLAALSMNIFWELAGTRVTWKLLSELLNLQQAIGLQSLAAQFVRAIAWGLVLVAYFSQQQKNDQFAERR